jgi:hypothetical protein
LVVEANVVVIIDEEMVLVLLCDEVVTARFLAGVELKVVDEPVPIGLLLICVVDVTAVFFIVVVAVGAFSVVSVAVDFKVVGAVLFVSIAVIMLIDAGVVVDAVSVSVLKVSIALLGSDIAVSRVDLMTSCPEVLVGDSSIDCVTLMEAAASGSFDFVSIFAAGLSAVASAS